METTYRVLIVEDVPTDAELNERAIQEVLTPCVFKRVETEEDFLRALDVFKPDIIISDYKMPVFDGMTALKLTLKKTPLTPFIIVTGSMNEDTAVDCMKAGATNYVIKQHIKKLGPAVIHALEEKKMRLERLMAEEALAKALNEQKNIMDTIPDIIYLLDLEGKMAKWNRIAEIVTGFSAEEIKGKNVLDFFPDKDKPVVINAIQEAFKKGYRDIEAGLLLKDGTVVPYHWTGVPLKDEQGKVIGLIGVGRDITERKRAEEELKKRVKELEDFYDMSVGRELRMVELKKKIAELKEELAKYEKTDN